MAALIQLALDEIELERAVQIAREGLAGGVDWLEAGTPLIKSEGMDAIRRLREEFGDTTILADMKTIDTGSMEVEMAAKAGADIVSVLGNSDTSTIRDALEGASRYGVKIMCDLIRCANPVERAVELEQLGVDYLAVHIGIDQQMVGMDPLDLLKDIVQRVKLPLGVAGGLDDESAAEAVRLGASIVIVGGFIIRSSDVEGNAARVRRAIDSTKPSKYRKKAQDEELHELFMDVSTSNVSDAMHRAPGCRGIKPLAQGQKIAGPAVTVATFEGDWAKPVEATDVAKEGDVIVIYNGSDDVAPWGELASHGCKQKGIAGVVIDGAIRDSDDIVRIGFPAWASAVTPNAGDPKGLGEINVDITCGGVHVKPGDWVIADDMGVMIVPRERAYEVARRAMEVKKMEDRVRVEIDRGKTLAQVVDLYRWEKK